MSIAIQCMCCTSARVPALLVSKLAAPNCWLIIGCDIGGYPCIANMNLGLRMMP